MSSLPVKLVSACLVMTCLFSEHSQAQNFEQAHNSLLRDIQTAQTRLTETQQDIDAARQNLGHQLALLETEVNSLRNQAATLLRAEDEKTLSLTRLQQRLQEWEDQGRFQQNQLGNFYRSTTGSDQAISRPELVEFLDHHTKSALAQLQPEWSTRKTASASGELEMSSTLKLGPIQLFATAGRTGLLKNETGQPPRIIYEFDEQASAGLRALRDSGKGTVTFDPTLSRAIQLQQQRDSITTHLLKGGLWVTPILFFGLVSLLVAAGKTVQILTIGTLLKRMKSELETVAFSTPPGQLRDDRLLGTLNQHRQKLEKWLGAIAVIAAIAPLLGLLGTVSGMIETFKLMTLFGAGDAQAVSSGISKALITTELGLIVAIPSLLLHAVLSRRIKQYCNELETDAISLSQIEGRTAS